MWERICPMPHAMTFDAPIVAHSRHRCNSNKHWNIMLWSDGTVSCLSKSHTAHTYRRRISDESRFRSYLWIQLIVTGLLTLLKWNINSMATRRCNWFVKMAHRKKSKTCTMFGGLANRRDARQFAIQPKVESKTMCTARPTHTWLRLCVTCVDHHRSTFHSNASNAFIVIPIKGKQ